MGDVVTGWLDYVVGRAKARDDSAADTSIEIAIDADDDGEMVADEVAADRLGFAEGQCFVIGYVDSKGRRTTRRITVWNIDYGADGTPMLYAKCHERRAMRSFRIDRIETIADLDGEIHESASQFMIETFGMAPSAAARAGRGGASADAAWQSLLDRVRHPAMLLATLAQADRHVDDRECDVALNFFETLDPAVADATTRDRLRKYFRRVRPNPDAIERAADMVAGMDAGIRSRFVTAAADLVEADGTVTDRELAYLDALSEDLIGVGASKR